jgi:hypothetical protein
MQRNSLTSILPSPLRLPSVGDGLARLPSDIRMAAWSQREGSGVQRSAFMILEVARFYV